MLYSSMIKRKLSDKKEVLHALIGPTAIHKGKLQLLIQDGSGLQSLYPLLLAIITKTVAELTENLLNQWASTGRKILCIIWKSMSSF